MKKISLSIIVVFLLVSSCGKKERSAPGPTSLAVQKIVTQDATTYKEFTANIEGQQNVEIRPKVNGFMKKIYVEEGQPVKKGQLLFKLETQILNQDASASKAMVQVAQLEVNRLKPLVERNIISQVQLETAKAKLAQAKSAYGSITANIGYGTLYSPVNGVIGTIPFKEGSLVNSASDIALTTVSDTENVRAYFTMNEKQLLSFNKIFKGATAAKKLKATSEVTLILVDDSEYAQKGKITTMSGLMNPTTGTTEFRADFKNSQGLLKSGSSGIIRLPILQRNVIILPQKAVFEIQGKQLVYVVGKGNKVKSRIIETNGTSGLNFIVTNGLSIDDMVVIEGASKLKDDEEIIPKVVANEDTSKKVAILSAK
ncbi:MAG: membrane fusion protein (multidrug efflux system) [Flavobacterium sp.]|jgi:membrane fusion protein (multidrug efflux system)